MKKKYGFSGVLLIVMSIANFLFAYFAYRGEYSAKPAQVYSIINGNMTSAGSLGGNTKAVEWYSFLFYVFIVVGIIFLIAAIVMFCVGESSNDDSASSQNDKTSKNSDKPRFVECPNCGELNSSNNSKCFKCKTDLSAIIIKRQTVASNEWVCPKCGRKNQNYVGTCGCGEKKTR